MGRQEGQYEFPGVVSLDTCLVRSVLRNLLLKRRRSSPAEFICALLRNAWDSYAPLTPGASYGLGDVTPSDVAESQLVIAERDPACRRCGCVFTQRSSQSYTRLPKASTQGFKSTNAPVNLRTRIPPCAVS